MRVLYVDDEPTIRRAVELWLSRHGIQVTTVMGLAAAREELEKGGVEGVFTDVWLEDGSGFELYDHIVETHPELAGRVAFVTGGVVESSGLDRRLGRLGCPVLRKPFDLERLKEVVGSWARSGPGPSHHQVEDQSSEDARG